MRILIEHETIEIGTGRYDAAAPQHGLYSSNENLPVEWLCDIIVGAAFKAPYDVLALRSRGEHYYARVRKRCVATHGLAQRKAVQPWKHHVQQHKVWLAKAYHLKALVAPCATCDLGEPFGRKGHLQHGAYHGIVLNNDYGSQIVHFRLALCPSCASIASPVA